LGFKGKRVEGFKGGCSGFALVLESKVARGLARKLVCFGVGRGCK